MAILKSDVHMWVLIGAYFRDGEWHSTSITVRAVDIHDALAAATNAYDRDVEWKEVRRY